MKTECEKVKIRFSVVHRLATEGQGVLPYQTYKNKCRYAKLRKKSECGRDSTPKICKKRM